jgi:hypothetical protein
MDLLRSSVCRSLVALAGLALLGAGAAACVTSAESSEEVDETQDALFALGPIEVGLGTTPPAGPNQRQRVAFTTQRTFAAPPLLFATAQGGAFPDTFAVSTAGVGTNAFSANLFRSDAAAGWAQPLHFAWMAMPVLTGYATQSGRATVGPQMNSSLPTVTVSFPQAFSTPPRIILTPRGGDYPDTFAASIRSVSTTGFVANVWRVDGGGYTQNLELDWLAWEAPIDFAPYGAADGTANVPPLANVNNKNQTFWVPFGKAFSQPPAVLATARGQNYRDTFAVSVAGVSATGFQANVTRVDWDGGWGQALQLDWLAIPPGTCPTGKERDTAGNCVAAAAVPQPPAGAGNTLYGRWTVSGGEASNNPGNQTFYAKVSGTTGLTTVTLNMTSATDSVLYVYGPDGSLVASDDNSGGNGNPRIQVSLAAGTYRIVAATKNLWVPGEFTLSADKAFLSYPQRLEIQRADQLVWVYDDVGSGADGDVSVWRPNLAAYPGYYSLGDVAMPYYGAPRGTYVVKGEGDLLARPLDFNWMWDDVGSGGDHDASVWDPIPPPGYTCIGTVVTLGYSKPSTDLIRCIKSEYVLPANGVYVWDDKGSGADHDISFFEATPVDHRSLPLGTFATLPYYSNPGGRAYFALDKSAIANPEFWGVPVTTATAQQYAPRVWLHGSEAFFPSSVDFFMPNVHQETWGPDTYLVTNQGLGCSSCTNPPFLTGQRPDQTPVPVYADVVNRTNTTITDVIYWQFYPYNLGKEVCIGAYSSKLGCAGYYQTFGNHVGDWEHVTVRFVDGRPAQVYLGSHDGGRTMFYGDKFLYLAGGHPEVYSARGSHGLYAEEGRHYYKFLPNGDALADDTQRGMAWDTWNNVVTFQPQAAGTYNGSLAWMNYLGYWGNPAADCGLSILGIEITDQCVLTGGPRSILEKDVSNPPYLPLE